MRKLMEYWRRKGKKKEEEPTINDDEVFVSDVEQEDRTNVKKTIDEAVQKTVDIVVVEKQKQRPPEGPQKVPRQPGSKQL